MPAQFRAISTQEARAHQAGALDAFGCPPERQISDGGLPCRHCLEDVAAGDEALLLAYRPFGAVQAYAEAGPIFLHAGPCQRRADSGEPPAALLRRQRAIVRGYTAGERITEGTGAVVETARVAAAAAALLERPEVAFVHVRSATNNCFWCRVDRG